MMISDPIRLLADPLSGALIGLVTFGLSAVLSIYLYRKALPVSRMDYASNSAAVIGEPHSSFKDDLEIRYCGKPVDRVTSLIAVVWNNGNQTINGSQVVDSDPLRIMLPDGVTILRAGVISATRPVVEANIEVDAPRSWAKLRFDFLDPGDGVAVVVLHTGSLLPPALGGTVRGLAAGPRRLKGSRSAALAGAVGVPVLLALSVGLVPEVFEERVSGALQIGLVAGIFIGMITFSLFAPQIMRRLRLRSFPKRLREEPRIAAVLPHLLDA